MISHRTRYSLAQFLAHQGGSHVAHFAVKARRAALTLAPANLLASLNHAINEQGDKTLMLVLKEIVATQIGLRKNVSPKEIYDERWHDLTQCLLLDGYTVQEKTLVPVDPSIDDAGPMDDDLVTALRQSALPQREAIIRKINGSTEAFRGSPPDYNAALTNAREALETLAVDLAAGAAQQPGVATYDLKKWGSVIACLRNCGELTLEEEKGLWLSQPRCSSSCWYSRRADG
ncbi:hypothetical protein [Comamonas thiooxydans]|uniref:hypothetical protein n=1 Tax=Comamonas thiooxydans TaxID=363952 RepID=UPI00196A19DD|nr:hypothetical protein [Comamonas thiooxydans]